MNLSINPVVVMTPVFTAVLFAEMVATRITGSRRYATTDTVASVAMAIGNVIASTLLAVIPLKLGQALAPLRLFPIEASPAALIICFVADDFIAYWAHRLGHRVRWVWADHVIHHSSRYYNYSTALRQGWFVYFTPGLLMMIPLLVVGFPPMMLIFVHGLNLSYQFFVHTESVRKLHPWVEWLMNTPSHHRVHHGSNKRYLDRNFGCVFILWDRFFGTFAEEDTADPPVYGLTCNITSFNPIRVSLHEWVEMCRDMMQSREPAEAIAYLLGPPGATRRRCPPTSKGSGERRPVFQRHRKRAPSKI